MILQTMNLSQVRSWPSPTGAKNLSMSAITGVAQSPSSRVIYGASTPRELLLFIQERSCAEPWQQRALMTDRLLLLSPWADSADKARCREKATLGGVMDRRPVIEIKA